MWGQSEGRGSPYGAWLVRRSWHLLHGSQGPFFVWEGQRSTWHRRWGFTLVNIDSTGFLQSPNTLAPLSSPLSVPHFPGGIWSGLPNLSWVISKGSRQVWVEAWKALACLPPTSFPRPGELPCCQLLPFSFFLKQPGVFPPSPSAGGERGAGSILAMPAGADALTLCV